MTISERIMILMEKKQIKAYELADALGISRSNLTRWKQREYVPSTEHIIAISQFFDVSTDWLLTGKEETCPTATKETKELKLSEHELELLKIYKELNIRNQAKILIIATELEESEKGLSIAKELILPKKEYMNA